MSALIPMPALDDIEEPNPAYRIRSMSDTSTPTEHAELRDTEPPDADDAAADRVMRTMLPPGTAAAALVDTSDSMIGALIADIAAAARVMMRERDERAKMAESSARNQDTLIEQQEQIIKILQHTQQTGEANYKLLLDAIRRLEASDSAQNGKLAHHADEMGELRNQIEELRASAVEMLPEAIRAALEPFAVKLETLETALAKLQADDAAGTAPQTPSA